MRIAIGLLVLATAACGDDGNNLPIGGNGNDGGFTFPDGTVNLIDGAIDGGTDASTLNGDASPVAGRVCLVADPRKLNGCATTGVTGLTVRLGTSTAGTSADGSFTVAGGTGTVWEVSGPSIVTSHMPLGDFEIPVITKTNYDAMIANNLQGLALNPGEGSVMVFVLNNGFGEPGAVADSTPSASWEPFYDAGSPTTFVQGTAGTGPEGMVWIPGLDVGTATVDVTVGTAIVTTTALPIFDGHITFATTIFPPP